MNIEAAILKSWLEHRNNGDTTLGVPTSQEFPYNGGSAQILTGGIGVWTPAGGVQWL